MTLHLFLFGVGVLSGAFGAILLRLAKPAIDGFQLTFNYVIFQVILNPYIFFWFSLYFIPGVIWLYLLSKYPVSFLQPLLAVTYIVTPLLAMVILGEQVSSIRWAGIGVILIGIYIISQS